jgi:hypothetical protein
MVKITKQTQLPERPIGKGKYFDGIADITEGYTVIGELIDSVEVGKPVCLLRFERNGVKAFGAFNTSVVQSIDGNLIKTENSIYKLEELEELEEEV